MGESLRRTAAGVAVAGGAFLFKWLVSQGKPATQISSADPVEGAAAARVVLTGGAFVIKWGAGSEPRTVEPHAVRTVATVVPPIQRAIATSCERIPLPADRSVATDGIVETPTRLLPLADPMADPLTLERRAVRIAAAVVPPIQRATATDSVHMGELHMNDSTAPGEGTPLAVVLPVATDDSYDTPPEVLAIRDARQRAAEARSAAERLLREAQAAEAQLIAQEEEALAATAAVKRERLAENARAAIRLEREAHENLSALQLEIQHVASMKSQTEMAVHALRTSLAEHEDQLRAVEARERKLQSDVTVAEMHAHDCTRARELGEAALNGALPQAPFSNGIIPNPHTTTPELPSPESLRAKYAAERRAADAARATERS